MSNNERISSAIESVALSGDSDAHALELTGETSGPALGSDGMTYPVGFLRVTTNPENGNAVGGLLVADNTGIPLEFMITAAVRPTAAQRVLYGKRLRRYIAVELCGRELIHQIKTKPRIIFVDDDEMLSLVAVTSIPVLQLQLGESLGSAPARPTVRAPKGLEDHHQLIDLRSLDPDMMDCFERIDQCREILAKNRDEYRL